MTLEGAIQHCHESIKRMKGDGTCSECIAEICKRFSKTGLKYYNNRRKQYKTRQFRTMTIQIPDMVF